VKRSSGVIQWPCRIIDNASEDVGWVGRQQSPSRDMQRPVHVTSMSTFCSKERSRSRRASPRNDVGVLGLLQIFRSQARSSPIRNGSLARQQTAPAALSLSASIVLVPYQICIKAYRYLPSRQERQITRIFEWVISLGT
jgi:hypothetical protein